MCRFVSREPIATGVHGSLLAVRLPVHLGPAAQAQVLGGVGASLARRARGHVLAEAERVAVGLDDDRVALAEAAGQDVDGQRVLDHPLDGALERPGAVDGVVAALGEQRAGGFGQRQADLALGEALAQVAELDVDDLRDLAPVRGSGR